ncbi:hypothetical protein N1031_06815 [Herbiconiux moechotypicola]|nr:hypothetical protein [Herbiconiux moechotypicola]MCS5729469.1 hypothetical protein [Herbiconiux moechotypicola]
MSRRDSLRGALALAASVAIIGAFLLGGLLLLGSPSDPGVTP